MKHLLLLVVFLMSFNVNAQDDSYVDFTVAQKENSKKISETKLSTTVTFDAGMNYDGSLFWHVIAKDGKEYYFKSTKEFTDVQHEEAVYSSLMEYVIETIGF